MNGNHNISAVIISFNEEKLIQQCIESILPITNDIIIVDSGSTDQTVSIATAAGARVFHMPWEGYGANKNFGNSKARYDWILSIDADEILDNDLANHINNIDKNSDTIYKIKSLVNYNGKWIRHCGWYPAWKLRFFHKTIAKWNLDPVHEALIYPSGINLKELNGELLHYSYNGVEDHKTKSTKYGKLKAESWLHSGKSIGVLKRLLGPTFKFLRTYILKLGFLDGREGYIISKMDARMIRTAIIHYNHLKKRG